MTMHLTNVRVIEKSHRKQSKRKSLQQAKSEHAKFLDKMGLSDVSARAEQRRKGVTATQSQYQRPGVQTSDNICASTGRKEQKYTGNLITGIATMHKSNSVPIINKQQGIDIANMRRN
jgi:hypothetical protein